MFKKTTQHRDNRFQITEIPKYTKIVKTRYGDIVNPGIYRKMYSIDRFLCNTDMIIEDFSLGENFVSFIVYVSAYLYFSQTQNLQGIYTPFDVKASQELMEELNTIGCENLCVDRLADSSESYYFIFVDYKIQEINYDKYIKFEYRKLTPCGNIIF